jgi:hypothetical protein
VPQANALPSPRRYWLAVLASIVFPLVYIIEPPAGMLYDLITTLEFALVLLAVVYIAHSLRMLLVEEFQLSMGQPISMFAWGLVSHLLSLRAVGALFNRLALMDTDFAHAGFLEVTLALICLSGAYLTGIGMILIGAGLAKSQVALYGMHRLLFYVFFVSGLLMTGYSIAVTLYNLAATDWLFGLMAVTFNLTDLSFIILCVLLRAYPKT